MATFSAYLNVVFDDVPIPRRVGRAASAGFEGFEVYGTSDLEKIAAERDEYEIEWVTLTPALPSLIDPTKGDDAIEALHNVIDLARDLRCRNVVLIADEKQPKLTRSRQVEQVVSTLREVALRAEKADVCLLIEPLNSREHPERILHTVSETVPVVEKVDSPNVKLLFDVYHEQISAGDVITTFRASIDQIGHVHIADTPGRHEPGTGELNYEGILEAIDASTYDGYVGCEFTPTTELSDIVETAPFSFD